MSDLKFTKEHEWLDVNGDVATVGITEYAQEQLGDVVFVDLPDVGKTVSQGDESGVVESVKAASDVYAPLDGEVVEVNAKLEDEPGLVNSDPQGEGWFMKMKMANTGQLDEMMDADGYKAFIESIS